MFKASGQAQFDKLLEKATSNFLLEPEWGSIMMICDLIRQKDCPPKYAVAAIKKKLHHQNPHVAMFGLQVLESIVKNCGSPVHDEVATKQFMEELREVAKTTHHENVKDKILELILTWAHAFRKIPTYRAIQDVLNIMKAEGSAFKPLVETDAMFVADTAPEWADGECCHRCRVEFGIVNRKHHCRACGQIFCNKCSSRMCTLPKFGIEKEVRVCESCFEKYGKPHHRNPDSHSNLKSKTVSSDQQILNEVLAASLAESQARAQNPAATKTKTEEELAEEEQLQLALAISQSEAEAKEIEKKRGGGGGVTYSANNTQTTAMSVKEEHSNPEKGSPVKSSEPDDPELARYLNRTYWETRSKDENSKEETGGGIVSALKGSVDKTSNKSWNSASYAFMPSAPVKENKDKGEQAEEIDHFVDNLRGQIEMFVNRMKSNSSRGRPIAYDTSVQGLFMNITALHSQLLNFIQDQDNARGNYEELQDKLGQIRDARAALDDLRREHTERLRIQAEEQERIKQFQMAQKLHIMRQKKQEYLQYQRQLAMQRMQEQEREMQMRIEQQKQQIGVPQQGQYYPQGPGYMQQQGGQEMSYMPQHGHGGGQFIAPPNVTLGQQPPPQQQMGQYIPQGPQFMPPGHQMPQMNQQPQQNVMQQQQQQHMPQQQQQPPLQQQQQPPYQQQQPSLPSQQQQQEPGYPPQQQQQPGLQPQQSTEQIPPLPHPEPSIAALISFDD